MAALKKGRSGTPTELFDTPNREIFSATCLFEKENKNICLTSYTVVLSTSRPLHDKTIYDDKEKPQIIKFYNFIKGGANIVDQWNEYYTTSSKSCQWVMVALSYMLDTARVNGENRVVFEK